MGKLHAYRFQISLALIFATLIGLVAYNSLDSTDIDQISEPTQAREVLKTDVLVPEGQAVATFAAGCFWCTEAAFQEHGGVTSVISGYAGGTTANPTYEQVYTQQSDHREAVQIFYDPTVVSYEELLQVLWRSIDPTDAGGQFVDRGFSYTTAIFTHDDEQEQIAATSIAELEASERFESPIVTPVLPFTTFYEAEDYHQDFYLNSAERYKNYEENSGREEYKAAVWAEIQAQ